MVYLFLADGFEEVEAITPFDFLKRANFLVTTVGVEKQKIKAAHGLEIFCDVEIKNLNLTLKEKDLIILPGGLQGTKNLYLNQLVLKYVNEAFKNAYIGAICAAPSILGRLNLLNGKKACCYPGFEKYLKGATVLNSPVVVDENIITSKGAGTAQRFSFELIRVLSDLENANYVKEQVQF